VSNLRIAAVDPGQHNVRGNDNSTRTLTFSRRISKHPIAREISRSDPERSLAFQLRSYSSTTRVSNPNGILKRARDQQLPREREREREYYSEFSTRSPFPARYPRAIRAPMKRESSRASSSYPRMQIGTRILPFVRLPAPIYLLSRLARPCCEGAARISSYRSAVHPLGITDEDRVRGCCGFFAKERRK